MKFRPILDQVLVRRGGHEAMSGRFHIPEVAQDRPCVGEVLAKGPDVIEEINVGLTVVFPKYAGEQLEVEGETLVFLRDHEVLVVLDYSGADAGGA